jgi:neutral ceramidase
MRNTIGRLAMCNKTTKLRTLCRKKSSHDHVSLHVLKRREFLQLVTSGGAALALPTRWAGAASQTTAFAAGEGVVDITPPLGIEMGGFHRAPGNERRITGIRQPTAARALVLQCGNTRTAIVSLDIACLAEDVATRIQKQVAKEVGIPQENVRICSTHTHSMPAFCYLRQWGAIPEQFMALVEKRTVEAVRLASDDLGPAELRVGKSRAVGANHNRTTKDYKTDEHFHSESTDAQRWLDTMVHAMHFQRGGSKRDLLWYHFSAHPVCFADEQAGPDWPGRVANRIRQRYDLRPSLLQGHAGDVNPGDGDPWRGDAEKTTKGVYDALCQAIESAATVKVDALRVETRRFGIPLNMELFAGWLEEYRSAPDKCASGAWVDMGFAKDWYRGNRDQDLKETELPITLSSMRIGNIALAFHPAELYSFYGLAIRRDSPFADTLVVGYTDGIIGYLTDPRAYEAGEYAAITVPKILDFPPFMPAAAAETSSAIVELLQRTAG